MANSTIPRYSPSGFFQPLTFVYFLAASVGAFVVSWLYQLGMAWIPIIQLTALLCAAFGGLLGGAAMWAIKKGHCRNRAIALILMMPLVGAGLGGSYYWEYGRYVSLVKEFVEKKAEEKGEKIELTNAQVREHYKFSDFISQKVEDGWNISNHGSGGSNMNGFMVWVIWGIEALILLFISYAMVWTAVSKPYCERCLQWAEPRKMLLHGLSRADADPLLEKADLDAIITMPLPAEPNGSVALALTADLCPKCAETGFLTVEEKRVVAVKKGKPQEKSVDLVHQAVLRADQRAKFLSRLQPG